MSQSVCKMPYLAMLQSPSKDCYQDAEADDFQNLTTSSLSKDTSVVKFSRRSDQQTKRQTERQTPDET